MIEVDRAMVEDYRIDLLQMMENAGRNLADFARQRFLDGEPRNKKIVVLAGRGGNGGGALACARRLSNWGAAVEIRLSKQRAAFVGVPGQQLETLLQMQVPFLDDWKNVEDLTTTTGSVDLIVDGLIGYSLSGQPHGSAAHLITWANDQSAPILSLDVPSGLNSTTGETVGSVIHAAATLTLALPKQGLESKPDIAGELYLADISVPPALYAKCFGLSVGPIFAKNDIIRLY